MPAGRGLLDRSVCRRLDVKASACPTAQQGVVKPQRARCPRTSPVLTCRSFLPASPCFPHFAIAWCTPLHPPHRADAMLWRFAAAAAAATATAVAAAPAPTAGLETYAALAVLEPSVATLHWTLNDSAVRLGLVITDAAVVTANASALWLGLGVGEPTSGGMLGADIVTGEFSGGPTCRLVDRHVPSVAYPLGSTAGGGRGVFPEPDDCGTVPTWGLVGCTVEPATGTLTLEVSRDLAAGDPAQDRPIVPGRNIFLYAYGDGFSYHGARRKSVAVDLMETGPTATGDLGLAESGRLPADAVASQLLTMPNYTIPTNHTEYACASFTVDLPPAGAGGGRRQVVAAEAVVDKTTEAGKMVHHFLIFSCAKEGLWDKFATNGPGSCFDEQVNCRDIVWVYVERERLDDGGGTVGCGKEGNTMRSGGACTDSSGSRHSSVGRERASRSLTISPNLLVFFWRCWR